jgi:hypothetical protein
MENFIDIHKPQVTETVKPRPRIIPKPTDEKKLARVNFQCNEHNHNDSASVSSSTFLAPSSTVPLSTSSSPDHEFYHYLPPNHSDEELTETPFEIKYIHKIHSSNNLQ